MANGTTQPLSEPVNLSVYDERLRPWVALVVIAGFFGFVGFAWRFPPSLPGDTVGIIIGGMLTLSTTVITYYFGSAIKGSK